jgi:uncharacterized protein
MTTPAIQVPREQLAAFCRKWAVAELSLFGSVLRADFAPGSDVDVLVEFRPDAQASLWDLSVMQDELKALLGREVDLVSKAGLRNPFRRARILATREVVVGTQP